MLVISSLLLILVCLCVLCFSQKKPFRLQADPVYTSCKTSGWAPRVMASSVVGLKAHFSTQSFPTNEPVVSVDWLHANLREPDVKVPTIASPCYVSFRYSFSVYQLTV